MFDRSKAKAHFESIALEYLKGHPIEINALRELCNEHGLFSDDDNLQFIIERQNEIIRSFARKPFRDEDGELHMLVNIVRGTRGGEDERQQVFMFLTDTTREDLEWLVEFHIKRVRQATDKAEMILGEYQRRFGKAATRQLRLNLDWPEPAVAEAI